MSELENIIVPHENVNDEFIIINSILFKNGDKVSKGDIVATIETSKTDFSIETGSSGYIFYLCKEGDEFPVGNAIAKVFDSIDGGGIQHLVESEVQMGGKVEPDALLQEVEPEFSKSALDLIKAGNIPKNVFRNKAFITKNDVLAYMEGAKINRQTDEADTLPDNVSAEKIGSTKRREIEYLSNGQNDGLTCTFSINIDNEGILNHARRNHKIFKLTIIPSLIFEVSRLLESFPILNAYFEKGRILKYNNINIGYAIDINFGLKVVTINDTSRLSVHEIEEQLNEKFDKYSRQILDVNDLANSTFTITDLSKSGIHYFQPLINKNQSAILGVSSVDFKTNSFNVSLTFDHRVTEGKVVSSFLNTLKGNLEKYYKQSESYVSRKDRVMTLIRKIDHQIKEGTYDVNEQLSVLKEILKEFL